MKKYVLSAAPPLRGFRLYFTACLGMILALFAFSRHVAAAIELVYFDGEIAGNRIRLSWETATELDNAGFRILRSTTGSSNPADYTAIPVLDTFDNTTRVLVPARGDGVTGATYIVYDENVTIGTRYYYFLQDIDTNNQSYYHGPVEVVAGQTPTPTNSGPTSTPTKTRTPTTTPVRTATLIVTRTRTPTPTASQQPSNTPLPPTPTHTLVPGLSDIDMTLTGIALQVTALTTETPAAGPSGMADTGREELSQSPAATENAGLQPATDRTQDLSEIDPQVPGFRLTGRIGLVIAVMLLCGALLTFGFFFFVRRSEEEDDSTP